MVNLGGGQACSAKHGRVGMKSHSGLLSATQQEVVQSGGDQTVSGYNSAMGSISQVSGSILEDIL